MEYYLKKLPEVSGTSIWEICPKMSAVVFLHWQESIFKNPYKISGINQVLSVIS